MTQSTRYTPTVEEVLASNATPNWIKDTLRIAITKDAVDAYYCMKVVTEVLEARMNHALGKATHSAQPEVPPAGMRFFYVSLIEDQCGAYIRYTADSEDAVRSYLERMYYKKGEWTMRWCAIYPDTLPDTPNAPPAIVIPARCGNLYQEDLDALREAQANSCETRATPIHPRNRAVCGRSDPDGEPSGRGRRRQRRPHQRFL